MEEPKPRQVDEGRAAILLGLSKEKIRQLSEKSGLGRWEANEHEEHVLFTYEELYRLCQLALRPTM